MTSSLGLGSRTLLLARLASHTQACCSSTTGVAATATRITEQVRFQAGFAKPGGDTTRQKKAGPRDGPGDNNPRLQALVELLSSPPHQTVAPLTPKEKAAQEAYRDRVTSERTVWEKDMAVKLHLQQAALRALPPRLRELASQPDHTTFPLNRNCLFDTPPEAYRDPAPGAEPAPGKPEKGRTARG